MENGTLLAFPGSHKPKSGSCFAALPEQYPWYSLDHIRRPTVHITYFDISSPMYLEPRHLIERYFSLRTEHLQIVYRKAVNRTWCEKTGLSDWVTDRLVIETDDIVRYQGNCSGSENGKRQQPHCIPPQYRKATDSQRSSARERM